MKAKFSPLEIQVFELLQSHYNFNVPKNNEVDVTTLFKSYTVNIDFEHDIIEGNKIQVFVSIGINDLKKPKAGYTMMVEGMGIFKLLNSSNLDKNQQGNLTYYSTLNMIINNLRNIIFQTSNIGPMGGYLLPPIDVLDLFAKKAAKQKKDK